MIIVSGGLGFIGQHLIARLVETSSYPIEILIIDDGSAYQTISGDTQVSQTIFNTLKDKWMLISEHRHVIKLANIDITNSQELQKVFQEMKTNGQQISCLYHLAGKKSISESIQDPETYYQVNVNGGKLLFNQAYQAGCTCFVFSSTATVYQTKCPSNGFQETQASSPDDIPHMYGRSKRIFEQYLQQEFYPKDPEKLRIHILRYFNPVANYPDGRFQEDITRASNLFPAMAKSLIGLKPFQLFGNTYPNTPDGSCQRDFIHVMDLVEAHIEVSQKNQSQNGYITILNVGRGRGISVLDIIQQFKNKISRRGLSWNYEIKSARAGDIGISFANTIKIGSKYSWRPKYDVEDMLEHFLNAHLLKIPSLM